MSANQAGINTVDDLSKYDLVITRVFDAPRNVVFKAWTDPAQVAMWWGPNGFTTKVHELDARAGGTMLFDMIAPDGTVFPMTGTFKEITEPERLVFVSGALNANGKPLFEVLTTVTLTEQGGKTTLTLQARVTAATAGAPQYLKGMEAGWSQTLDRLGRHVESLGNFSGAGKPAVIPTEFVITREFDAPRELVFKAWTEAERLARWWGPKGCAIEVRKLEVKPGGVFHYVMRLPNGQAMWGKFVYREIARPERMVFVNSFSDESSATRRSPFHESWPLEVLNTMTLAEHDGKTTLTLRGGPINATAEERKVFLSFHESMQKGFEGTFEQLEQYLASL